jgi:predicted nucleotidyltransferase
MIAVRPLATRLDHLLARRAEARRRLVEPQAVAAIAALRLAGAEVELVGSLARGEFRVNSDVDFLVLARGLLSETLIFTTICDHLKAASFDLVFADRLAPVSLEVMRRNARPRA